MNYKFIYYMIGQGSWFLSQGLQMVLFPTILVFESGPSGSLGGIDEMTKQNTEVINKSS